MKFNIVNLGCKVNQVEVEQIASDLLSEGFTFTREANLSEIAVINTCTVTSKADKKSLQTIRFYQRLTNIRYVFITGCYVELEKDLLSKLLPMLPLLPQSDVLPKARVVTITQKQKRMAARIIANYVYGSFSESKVATSTVKGENNKQAVAERWMVYRKSKVSADCLETQQVDFYNHTRAFVKIQDGCNFFCSYCRIPFARGGAVSRSWEDIIAQVKRLAHNQTSEIVLCGINIGTYQSKSINFNALLEKILQHSQNTLVRISSIEPFSITKDFFDVLRSHPNVSPHLHLPLQATSNAILKTMNRRYTIEFFYQLVEKIYRYNSNFAISTDIITGFPTESDEDFLAGLNFIKKCDFNKLHVFPYSPRPFTDAEKDFTPLPHAVVKQRVQELRALSNGLVEKQKQKLLHKTQRFILETKLSPPPTTENSDTESHFNDSNYLYYKGTSDYYVKGVCRLSKKLFSDLGIGRVVCARLINTEPALFEVI